MKKNRLIVLLIGLWIVAVLSLRTPYAWGKITFSIRRVSDCPHKSTAADNGHQIKGKKHKHKIKVDQRHCPLPSIDIERVTVRIDTPTLTIAQPRSGLAIPHRGRAPPPAA